MKRCFLAGLVLLAVASSAPAHFIWVVPGATPTQAKVFFSDGLEPDAPGLLDRIKQTKIYAQDATGALTPLAWTKTEDCYIVDLPAGTVAVHGSCVYGVLKRGDSKPFLLNYHMTLDLGGARPAGWESVPFQVRRAGQGSFVVAFNGAPTGESEVVIAGPEGFETTTLKTGPAGEAALKAASLPTGLYGVRAQHIIAKAGEHDGKKYDEIRHYATLVYRSDKTAAAKPDAAATRLLADARAARATWTNFPGFTAEIRVTGEGKGTNGLVEVDAKGNVTVADLDEATAKWVRRVLGSVVGHRIGGGETDTPCAFADSDEHHPLGRAINVLNDEMHSSYRIRDRQVMVVNRETGGSRFSITIQANRTNEEGKFLPSSFVVHYWDTATGALQRVESTAQTWMRIGAYDLPASMRVVYADKNLSAREITLSNVKLTAVK